MGGGNIDPFYNTMHSSGSEASSTVASPTLHTSNEGQTSPTDANIESKYPSVAFTTRAPNGVETKITMAMEKSGVCGGPSSTKLSLDIPRIDVSRITIGPKDHAFVLYAVDGRQTTLSVSGNVTYDIQLLDSECSATKGEETTNSTATLSDTVHQENDATPVPPQATSPAPSHETSVRDAAELLQSLRSLLATPHVRAPRARNQFPMFNDDVESGQPPDGDGPFIFSQDEHPASRTQSLRRRDSHTLLRRPSQEFLTVPSPEIGLFATPPDAGRGRPADVRSALRSVLSISRTGSMNSERNMSRDRQEHWGIPGSQERVVTFEHEQHASSPEAEQRFSPVRERNHIHGRRKRASRRLPTPPPAPWFSREIQPPSPSDSPIVDSPAAPSIRLQAPTPLMGGQRPLAGGRPPLANGLMPTVGGLMPLGEGERNGTPYPPGFVPSPNAAWAGYIKRTTQHNVPATQHVPTVVQHNVAAAPRNLTAELNPSAAGNNFFAGLHARGANQAQNQPSQTTQLLAPTTIGTQYGFSAPYSNWTPYTGALGQGTPLTPLGITPNFSSVSPGYPLPPMTMSSLPSMPLSSMPTLLPMATGASVNTPWYTPASCSLLAPPTGGLASSLSTSNPSPNVHGPSNGVFSYSSPNTLAPPSNVYGTSSPNVYGGASSNSHGPPSPNASHTHIAYVSSSSAGPTASAHSAPAHLCHAPWLAPQSLAATPTRLAVPSATYASDSTTLHSPTERRLAPTSSHRAPPITPFAAFASPYSIAMPDQPEPVIPERPSFEPQTPFRSFTPTSSRSPSPTRIARTPFPMTAPPLSPSPESVEERDDNNSSGWASSWVDPHAGWGEGDAYAGWDAWDLGASAPSAGQGRPTAAGATANNAQGSNSLYDALFGSPERAPDPASGGHATTDKKVAFARISESDWYPQ